MYTSKISTQLRNRPWLMNVKPLWLREKLFWKLYANTKNDKYLCLFDKNNLEFAPQISLHLLPTDIAHQSIAFLGFYELTVSRHIAQLAKVGGLMIDVVSKEQKSYCERIKLTISSLKRMLFACRNLG
jgi:hypothetical protein